MRIKRNGEQYAQDMSIQHHAAALGVRVAWCGDIAQTLAFYRRITAMFLADLEYRRPDYQANLFDMELLTAVEQAVDRLAASLVEVA